MCGRRGSKFPPIGFDPTEGEQRSMRTTEWLEAAEARRVCQLAAEHAIRISWQTESAERARPTLSRLLFIGRHTASAADKELQPAAQ